MELGGDLRDLEGRADAVGRDGAPYAPDMGLDLPAVPARLLLASYRIAKDGSVDVADDRALHAAGEALLPEPELWAVRTWTRKLFLRRHKKAEKKALGMSGAAAGALLLLGPVTGAVAVGAGAAYNAMKK